MCVHVEVRGQLVRVSPVLPQTGDETQVIGLGNKHLYLQNCIASVRLLILMRCLTGYGLCQFQAFQGVSFAWGLFTCFVLCIVV